MQEAKLDKNIIFIKVDAASDRTYIISINF